MGIIRALICLGLVGGISSKSVDIMCDLLRADGGWTVIQRRMGAEPSFERSWDEYVKGFGSLEGSFWLGLDLIHKLTQAGDMVLRIDMKDFADETAVAQYSHFQVGSDWELYRLNISGYSGNAGDSLSNHNQQPFSTKDRDNDSWDKSCSKTYNGAWWYEACHRSNLNGLYLGGSHTSYANGVNWHSWRGLNYSLKMTEMKIRPKYLGSTSC